MIQLKTKKPMTNLEVKNRSMESSFRVATRVAEAIADNPFLEENTDRTDYNFFEFSKEIEGDIKSCMAGWDIELEELEFRDIEEILDNETFGIPEGMDKETYYNQYK